MRFGGIAKKAKKAFDQRGGSDALKQDIGELKDIARRDGSLADKAKDAAAALKEPGTKSQQAQSPGTASSDQG